MPKTREIGKFYFKAEIEFLDNINISNIKIGFYDSTLTFDNLTNLAESLRDLFLFLALTDTDGGEMRTLASGSSCIAI